MDHTVKALVLAAGKGTRLQTEGIDLPKVMRLADGKPLLHYVLSALDFLPPEDVILVVGWKKEAVLEAYPQYPHAVQAEQHGTGHAVQCAAHLLEGFQGHVIICCGDAPLHPALRRPARGEQLRPHPPGCGRLLPGHCGGQGLHPGAEADPGGEHGHLCVPCELYLTDVPAFIKEAGGRVGLCDTCSPDEMLGVNTVEQLQEVEAILRKGGVSRG